MPLSIREFVISTAESLQVSEDMVAVAVLAVTSLCVQGKFAVQPKLDWIEPINLYTLIVAPPSERKSPTMKAVTSVIYDYMMEENKRRQPAIAEYNLRKEILTKKINSIKEAASKPKKDTEISIEDALAVQKELDELEAVAPLHLIADDVTPESLVKLLQDNNEKMGIVSAEGGIFGTIAGRYNDKVNIDIFLKAYSGEPVSVNRVSRKGENLEHPLLTMVLAVQPTILNDVLSNATLKGRGFVARFLYSIPVTKIGKRHYDTPPVSNKVRNEYEGLIYRLLEIPETENAELIQFSKEAHNLSRELFYQLEPRLIGDLEDIDSWAAKFHGQVMRIAGVLHCVKYEKKSSMMKLEGDTIKDAIAIGNYFLEHALVAFAVMGYEEDDGIKDAKYILKRLDESGNHEISKRDLYQLCNGKFPKSDMMDSGLDVLVKRGYIRIERLKTGGRPTDKIIFSNGYIVQKVQKVQKEEYKPTYEGISPEMDNFQSITVDEAENAMVIFE